MKKLLILTNDANGLYLFRKELIESFMADGYEIVVSLPSDKNCEKIEKLGCKIVEAKLERRGNNPIKDGKLFLSYCHLIRKIRPKVVLTYTIKPNLYGGLACRLLRVPYLCNITGLGTAIENESMLSRILLKVYKISTKNANCVFFQNEKNKTFMNRHGIACNNYKMLPGSGVNLTKHIFREYSSEGDKIKFLAVIRIMKDKGIEEYLQAAQILHEKYKNLEFGLVGDYEEESRHIYEPLVKTLVDKNIIKYYGHVDNVPQLMAESHVIVHPSYHEGLSNVLLEAAACGRPVLASNINGCVETFIEGKSGFSFEIKSTEALVEAVEKILKFSFEQRRQMGISARAWVEDKFDRNLVLQAYNEELNRL